MLYECSRKHIVCVFVNSLLGIIINFSIKVNSYPYQLNKTKTDIIHPGDKAHMNLNNKNPFRLLIYQYLAKTTILTKEA